MAVVLISACAVICVALVWYLWGRQRHVRRKLPPGPPGLPLVGCHKIKIKELHFVLTDLRPQYGDLVCVRYFGQLFIGINSAALMKKAFAQEPYQRYFNDRPPSFSGKYLRYNYKDLLFRSYDDTLVRLRQIVHNGIRWYGDGSHYLRKQILEEVTSVVNTFSVSNGKDFDPSPVIHNSLCSLLSIMLSGERISDTSPARRLFTDFIDAANHLISPVNYVLASLFPFSRYLPGRLGNTYREIKKMRAELLSFFVTRLRSSYTHGTSRGLVDEFFRVQMEESWLTDEYIISCIMDLNVASIVTTKATLLGFLLLLIRRPQIQKRIQDEIDSVHLDQGEITVKDKSKLPYTEACLLEALRYLTPAPLTVPHITNMDVKFEGFNVPAGSLVFGNLWAAHHDEKIWNDPLVFRPERFLDESGRVLPPEHKLRQSLVPFGAGRRQCIGETFAKTRLFLYITKLLEHFTFLPPEDSDLSSEDPRDFKPHSVHQPFPFKCRVRSRRSVVE